MADDFGGLTSVTGSVGGGSGTYTGNRGILFPEFDQWAHTNGLIMKMDTSSTIDDRGIREIITLDIVLNDGDGLMRPSSTIFGNDYFPKIGDQHPTIEKCYLKSIKMNNYNSQPDHFRGTLEYAPLSIEKGTDGDGGGDNGQNIPTDDPFVISWNPIVSQSLIEEDLNGKPVRNPNGEPYELYTSQVRLDGIATWNQREWNQTDSEKWSNKINKKTWSEGEYKFNSKTVLVNYVVGNLAYYTDSRGKRVPYYQMKAGISFNSKGWNNSDDREGIKVRKSGSFYYNIADANRTDKANKYPKDPRITYSTYDLDENGVLLTRDGTRPTSSTPQYDVFKLYEDVTFNFVDI
jgi:hypothetical protein